jgi:hypothetical protein
MQKPNIPKTLDFDGIMALELLIVNSQQMFLYNHPILLMESWDDFCRNCMML